MTRTLTLLGYAVLCAAAVGLEAAGRRSVTGTFGDLISFVLRRWPVRLLVLATWLWFGWHAFVRVDWR